MPVSRPRPPALEVLDPGLLALLQDLGRPGHMAVGVGRSGAADRASHSLGARLLGNPEHAASIEATLGGLRVRAHGTLLLCLTGATAPATVAGRPVAHASPFVLRDGHELSLGMPSAGLRTYLSVRGGLAVDPVLGSRATDLLAGLGPAALSAGTVLPVGPPPGEHPPLDVAPVASPSAGPVVLSLTPGPRYDWFAGPEALARTTWTVSGRSDRTGIRLEGPPLQRHPRYADAELPSEGMVRGAVQVPPSGEPVLLLNDHPVTGGYPVVGVVRAADVDRAAQLTPGQHVRLRWERAPRLG